MPDARAVFDEHLHDVRTVAVPALSRLFRIRQTWHSSGEDLGSVLWQASLVLSSRMAERFAGRLDPGAFVVELGCGTAALGALTAAALGAVAVASDLPAVCAMARDNVTANVHEGERVCLLPFRWGDRWPGPAPTMVVASDVVYARELHAPLAVALRELLHTGLGFGLIVFKVRQPLVEIDFFDDVLPQFGLRGELDERRLCVGDLREAHITAVAASPPPEPLESAKVAAAVEAVFGVAPEWGPD